MRLFLLLISAAISFNFEIVVASQNALALNDPCHAIISEPVSHPDVDLITKFQDEMVFSQQLQDRLEVMAPMNTKELLETLLNYTKPIILDSRAQNSSTLRKGDSEDRKRWVQASEFVANQVRLKNKPTRDKLVELVNIMYPGTTIRSNFEMNNGGIEQMRYVVSTSVSEAIDVMFNSIKKRQQNGMHPIVNAALAYQNFVSIHPFEDGNGRTGRLFLDWLLLSEGYRFTIFDKPFSSAAAIFPDLIRSSTPSAKVVENVLTAITQDY